MDALVYLNVQIWTRFSLYFETFTMQSYKISAKVENYYAMTTSCFRILLKRRGWIFGITPKIRSLES